MSVDDETKRRRTPLACAQCNRSKVKCDISIDGDDNCRRCVRLSLKCEYPTGRCAAKLRREQQRGYILDQQGELDEDEPVPETLPRPAPSSYAAMTLAADQARAHRSEGAGIARKLATVLAGTGADSTLDCEMGIMRALAEHGTASNDIPIELLREWTLVAMQRRDCGLLGRAMTLASVGGKTMEEVLFSQGSLSTVLEDISNMFMGRAPGGGGGARPFFAPAPTFPVVPMGRLGSIASMSLPRCMSWVAGDGHSEPMGLQQLILVKQVVNGHVTFFTNSAFETYVISRDSLHATWAAKGRPSTELFLHPDDAAVVCAFVGRLWKNLHAPSGTTPHGQSAQGLPPAPHEPWNRPASAAGSSGHGLGGWGGHDDAHRSAPEGRGDDRGGWQGATSHSHAPPQRAPSQPPQPAPPVATGEVTCSGELAGAVRVLVSWPRPGYVFCVGQLQLVVHADPSSGQRSHMVFCFRPAPHDQQVAMQRLHAQAREQPDEAVAVAARAGGPSLGQGHPGYPGYPGGQGPSPSSRGGGSGRGGGGRGSKGGKRADNRGGAGAGAEAGQPRQFGMPAAPHSSAGGAAFNAGPQGHGSSFNDAQPVRKKRPPMLDVVAPMDAPPPLEPTPTRSWALLTPEVAASAMESSGSFDALPASAAGGGGGGGFSGSAGATRGAGGQRSSVASAAGQADFMRDGESQEFWEAVSGLAMKSTIDAGSMDRLSSTLDGVSPFGQGFGFFNFK